MANEKITSLAVAELAGVSQSAVSRFFTPGTSVSKKTADKIRTAAAQLGYRPNILARSLKSGKSRIIGLVVAYLENYFYPEALERLSASLQKEGYHVLVFMAAPTETDVAQVVQEILDYQVDGIVLASTEMTSVLAERCEANGIPVVLFNRAQEDPRLSSVSSDNRTGGRMLANLLVAGGHERIAYIAGTESALTQRDREAGFREGLAAAGRDLFAREAGDFKFEQAQTAARRLFNAPQRPDAVFVANDHMAFAVMDVARFELGLSIPDDVSIVGYDDVPIAAWPAYNLTTVRQDVEAMVRETVAMLMGAMANKLDEPRRTVLDGALVIRKSARTPKPI
ncbi:LacI family transcriptional regulator [Devosia pacifica]|uniref:LacI family transcriptional regulator n=1 Tax=Devosia pacifica TaxID=1335967 RepID=A0A918SBF6_9HYPH|nr:LacI family DNA-binding transcriptional regulator [Devosia pacifica]GHA32843.1 LacI family transcriptional regulator [Devosia pacifica]